MPERSRQRRGLTLVETIVVIFVFSLLTLTITQLLNGGLRAWRKGQARFTLRTDARDALDQVQAEIRQATTAPTLSNPFSGSPTYYKTLALTRTPAGGGTTTSVTFAIDSTTRQLTRTESSVVTVLAENVVDQDSAGTARSYFTFVDTTNTTVGIKLLLVQNAFSNPNGINSGAGQSENVSLYGSAYWLSNQTQLTQGSGAQTTQASAVSLTGVSLGDPRSPHVRWP